MVLSVTKLIAAAAGVLAGTAIAKELDKPPEERTWHGMIAGIPYDFRPPTAEKLKRSVWDPDNPKLFVPHAFGVGLSVNFARLVAPPAAPDRPVAEIESH
jgi:Family of unknown function (DUF5808)